MSTFAEPAQRVCQTDGCETILSRFNSAVVCSGCSNRLEVGGVRIHLRPQHTIVGPRELVIDRSKPTTDGGVPLPGVVPGRERSYEEMIRKPAARQDKPAAAKCPECGTELPKGHQGWLCRLCAVAGTVTEDVHLDAIPDTPADVEIDSNSNSEPAVSEPEPEPAAAETAPRVVRPKTLKPRAAHQTKRIRGLAKADPPKRPGRVPTADYTVVANLRREGLTLVEIAAQLGAHKSSIQRAVAAAREAGIDMTPPPRERPAPPPAPTLYDQAEAARIYRESGGNLSEVARQLGCAWDTARSTVARELDADARAAARRPITRGRRRSFDRDEAVRIFREARSVEETARRLGVRGESMRRALKLELGDEYDEILSHRTDLRARRKGIAAPTPAVAPPSPTRDTPATPRAELEQRLDELVPTLDQLQAQRDALTVEISALLDEFADINYRLSKLSDA